MIDWEEGLGGREGDSHSLTPRMHQPYHTHTIPLFRPFATFYRLLLTLPSSASRLGVDVVLAMIPCQMSTSAVALLRLNILAHLQFTGDKPCFPLAANHPLTPSHPIPLPESPQDRSRFS